MKVNLSKNLTVKSPYCGRSRSAKHKVWGYKKHNAKCVYCKIRVSFKNKYWEKNHATADHIFSRNDIRRTLNDSIVLSCNECNDKRNNEETHRNKLLYHKMCFGYLSMFRKLEFTPNGNCLIDDEYHDIYFDTIPLTELIYLSVLSVN